MYTQDNKLRQLSLISSKLTWILKTNIYSLSEPDSLLALGLPLPLPPPLADLDRDLDLDFECDLDREAERDLDGDFDRERDLDWAGEPDRDLDGDLDFEWDRDFEEVRDPGLLDLDLLWDLDADRDLEREPDFDRDFLLDALDDGRFDARDEPLEDVWEATSFSDSAAGKNVVWVILRNIYLPPPSLLLQKKICSENQVLN